VVKELLHTEETYIKGLTKMMEVRLLSSLRLDRTDCQLFVASTVQVYVRPLQALARGASDGRVAELNNITSKAEYIINLNTTLLSDLKERVDNWSNTQTIGDIFIKMVTASPPSLPAMSACCALTGTCASLRAEPVHENVHAVHQ
jgi:hypothetical protein